MLLIETERLTIDPLKPTDWAALQCIAADFTRSEYAIYDMPLPTDDREIRALTEAFASSGLWFAVRLGGDMIGYICFHQEGSTYDLGFCFHSAYHGKGYAYEACVAALDYMTEARGATRFTAGTALNNLPSRKLLEKLGFILKGTEMLSFHKDKEGNDITFEGGLWIQDRETAPQA